MPIKALPYPSEQATVEQEKVQKQFTQVSKQIEEIKSNSDSVRIALEQKIDQLVAVEQEPVFAFRATSVKDSGSSSQQHVSKNPGKISTII